MAKTLDRDFFVRAGRRGGRIGGPRRKAVLTPEQRSEIARKAGSAPKKRKRRRQASGKA